MLLVKLLIMKKLLLLLLVINTIVVHAQVKILFDASKAETAGNADWVIDEDGSTPGQLPTPSQLNITSSTAETYWTGALSYWGIDCVNKGYHVETLPIGDSMTYGNNAHATDLSHYNVFIVDEPNIRFTQAEKIALLNFVYNGGALFMISDHTGSDRNNDGWDSPAIWNDFMTNNGVVNNPFGISFDLATFSETSTNIALPGDSLISGPMGTVTAVQWSSGTSMTISTAANSSVKAVIYKTAIGTSYGSTGVLCAHAIYGNGRVVAIGDSSPPDDGTGASGNTLYNGYTGDASGNHRPWLMNATIWLATPAMTLPVSLTDFSATREVDLVRLQWTMDNMNEVRNFEVERSSTGRNFVKAGTVGAGIQTHYSFSDAAANSDRLYYRIRIVYRDGRTDYSQVISLSGTRSSFHLLSNPVTDQILFSHPAAEKAQYTIRNSSGALLLSGSIPYHETLSAIPVQALAAGIYFISYSDGDQRYTEKFVKE